MYMYYGGALCINNILAILSFKLKNSCPREMTVYAKHMNIRICIDVDNNTQAFLYFVRACISVIHGGARRYHITSLVTCT